MRRRILLSVALFALLLGGCSRKKKIEQPERPKTLLAQAPLPKVEGAVAYAVFRAPAETLAIIEKLAQKAGPVPPGSLTGQLYQLLLAGGLSDTSVVDLKGPVVAIVLDPTKHPMPLVVGVTVPDKHKFLAALQPAWQQKDQAGGIYHFTRQRHDPKAVFSGGGQKATRTDDIYLAFKGNLCVASPDKNSLREALPQATRLVSAAGADFQAVVETGTLTKLFAPQINMARAGISALKTGFMRSDEVGGTPEEKARMGQLLEKLLGGILDLALEIDRLELRALSGEEGFESSLALVPKGGGKLAGFIAAQKKQPLRMTGILPDDHFLQMAVNVQWRQYKKELIEFTEQIFDLFGKKKMPEEFRQVLGELYEALGEEIVASEGIGTDGLEVVEAISLVDSARARKAFEKAITLVSEYFADLKVMGIGYEFSQLKAIGKHAGHDILEWSIKFDLEQANPVQAEAIRKVYGGDELKMLLAFAEKEIVLALGKKARQRIEKALDGLASKGSSPGPALASAAGDYLSKCGGFMMVSISQVMNMGVAMKQPALAAAKQRMTSGLFIGGNTDGGRLNLFLRLPAAHLEEIGSAIKSLTGAAAPQQPSMQ